MDELTEIEKDMAQRLCKWRDRILKKVANRIESHLLDEPVEDLTEHQRGFEMGINYAVREATEMMNDDSYFS